MQMLANKARGTSDHFPATVWYKGLSCWCVRRVSLSAASQPHAHLTLHGKLHHCSNMANFLRIVLAFLVMAVVSSQRNLDNLILGGRPIPNLPSNIMPFGASSNGGFAVPNPQVPQIQPAPRPIPSTRPFPRPQARPATLPFARPQTRPFARPQTRPFARPGRFSN